MAWGTIPVHPPADCMEHVIQADESIITGERASPESTSGDPPDDGEVRRFQSCGMKPLDNHFISSHAPTTAVALVGDEHTGTVEGEFVLAAVRERVAFSNRLGFLKLNDLHSKELPAGSPAGVGRRSRSGDPRVPELGLPQAGSTIPVA